MLGTIFGVLLGAELISELIEDNEEKIFEDLENKAYENNIRPTSFVETHKNGIAYRVYGDGYREKEKM